MRYKPRFQKIALAYQNQIDEQGNWLVPETLKQITFNEASQIKNNVVTIKFKVGSQLNDIEAGSFNYSQKLQSVDLSNCNLITILKEDLFYNCICLETVILPKEGNLHTIEGGCFSYCSLTSITFPRSLKYLKRHQHKENNGAFSDSTLKEVNYYDDNCIEEIGWYSFRYCNLEEFEIGPNLKEFAAAAFEMHSTRFKCFTKRFDNQIYKIEEGILYTNATLLFCPPGIQNPKIKEGIEILGGESFCNSIITDCTFLPSSLRTVSGFCFYSCLKLRRIYIPPKVTEIGQRCFQSCSQLVTVVLSQSIKTIQMNTFYNCPSLTSLIIPYGVKTIQESSFFQCLSLKHLYIPDSVTSISKNAFVGSGVQKCGITCSNEEREVIKQQTLLTDSIFEICNQRNEIKTCNSRFSRSYLVFLVISLVNS